MLTNEEKEKLHAEDPYWFEELFERDIESWFSSDIACCDECIDDFLEYWPHAYSADKCTFQNNPIGMSGFYSGSRLSESYTEEEFYKFLPLVPCPRCGSELKHNIWPYELPFNVVEDFEDKLNEIAGISAKTPFMLLEHYFAREIYDVISELASEVKPTKLLHTHFRARMKDSLKSHETSEFDFPPNKFASEGRYNHAGISALYLASDMQTCFHEMREADCIIAEIDIEGDLKVLDLLNPFKAHEKHSDLLNTLTYSALMSAKQSDTGWFKPKYIFTRFIADCAKYAGFDAIKYPSTRNAEENYNIVILNMDYSLTQKSSISGLKQYTANGVSPIKNT